MGIGTFIGNVLGGGASAAAAGPAVAVDGLAKFGTALLNKFGPEDPVAKAAAQLEFAKLDLQQFATEAGIWQGVQATNLAEANSVDKFNSRWRPFIGWVCGWSLAAYFIPKALVGAALWVVAVKGNHWALVPFPDLGIADLMALTMNMLGLGWMRTVDKKNGVAS